MEGLPAVPALPAPDVAMPPPIPATGAALPALPLPAPPDVPADCVGIPPEPALSPPAPAACAIVPLPAIGGSVAELPLAPLSLAPLSLPLAPPVWFELGRAMSAVRPGLLLHATSNTLTRLHKHHAG